LVELERHNRVDVDHSAGANSRDTGDSRLRGGDCDALLRSQAVGESVPGASDPQLCCSRMT